MFVTKSARASSVSRMSLRVTTSKFLPVLWGSCFLLGCSEEPRVKALSRPSVELAQWKEAGFVELVPPIRPPTSADGSDRISVWLRLPSAAQIITDRSSGEPRLRMPSGAELDRVEVTQRGDLTTAEVEDVRGTTFGPEGESFHVFRRRDAELWGLEWARGDAVAQRAADQALAAGLPPAARGRLVELNQCAGCHTPDKPAATRVAESTLPHRKTDASGLYHPQSVLERETPVEFSRPNDPNLADPFVRFRCATGGLSVREAGGSKSPRCSDGSVPLATLDLQRALAAGDPHAQAVCASRKFIWEHLDELGRVAFADAFSDCGIGPQRNHEALNVGGSKNG